MTERKIKDDCEVLSEGLWNRSLPKKTTEQPSRARKVLSCLQDIKVKTLSIDFWYGTNLQELLHLLNSLFGLQQDLFCNRDFYPGGTWTHSSFHEPLKL